MDVEDARSVKIGNLNSLICSGCLFAPKEQGILTLLN
jgi:hypothetical protein